MGATVTFASHTWGAAWGTLVAALADGGADRNRRVWVDIFAIRQWPGNGADLAFEGVIARCASFAIVCQAAPLCEHNTQDYNARGDAYLSLNEMFARQIKLVPAEVRRMIAFLRVWCLVELNAALRKGDLVVIMKAGKMGSARADGCRAFVADKDMSKSLGPLIDIERCLLYTSPSPRDS